MWLKRQAKEINRFGQSVSFISEHKNVCCSDLFQGTDISYLHFSVDKQKRLFKKEAMDVNEVCRFILDQFVFKGSCTVAAKGSVSSNETPPTTKAELWIS